MSLFDRVIADFGPKASICLPLALVLLDFIGFGFGKSVTFTNAAQASEVHPRQVEPPSYWIGSHTLDYTPNPFLIGRSRGSRLNTVESNIVTNILASPSTSTTEIPARWGRKIKRRRRLRNKNSKSRNPNRIGRKLKTDDKSINEPTKDSDNAGTPKIRRLGGRRPNGLIRQDVDEVKTFTAAPKTIIKITTPDPVVMDWDPRSSEISRSFANIHPENLTPTYFRNIILKAMMDRLVGVGSVSGPISVKQIV